MRVLCRLGHSAGQNLSATAGGNAVLRAAVFHDYCLTPQLFRRDAEQAALPSENGDGPPPEDMWRDWSTETRAAAAQLEVVGRL